MSDPGAGVMRQRPQRALGVADFRRPGRAKHGLSRREIDVLLAAQGGVCALCGRPADGAPWQVDHDHALARTHDHPESRGCRRCFRGIIHQRENSLLGFAGDSVELLEMAAEYLRRRAVA